ncbi:SDR family oxidoreductase [Brevibacterium album]|uniref:SDR family oxidoreductase n=1 Tax=Brevibacterium album TaxID=417948 RepID=UPI0003FE016B|nr:SDR family NAD(P)-dependent oxidoreductase [Brevibacterium album]
MSTGVGAPGTAIEPAGLGYSRSLVLITGGARGIGRHLAAGFVRAGYPVLLTARTRESAIRAAAEIVREVAGETTGAEAARTAGDGSGATGGSSTAVLTPRVRGAALDQTDAASVAELVRTAAQVSAEWDAPLRVLVNNAGRIEATEGPLWEADAEDLAAVLETNLVGVFRLVRALLPGMLATAEASGAPVRIIDLNSGSGAQGTAAHPAYSASKAGLFRLAESLVEYGHARGLRVFEMAPGVVESDMTRSMPMHDHRSGDDWTPPAAVVDLALALASGELDEWTGRYVRAGRDTPASLAAAGTSLTAGELADGERVLTVRM